MIDCADRGEGKRMKIKRYALLLLWPVAGLTLLLARCSHTFAEHVFARGIYRIYRTPISFLTGLLPWSLGELILYAIVPAAAVGLIVWIVHMTRGRPGRVLLRGAVNLLCILGIVFFMFVFGCGANYYRDTYAESIGMEVAPGTDEELQGLCMALTARANALRAELEEYEDAAGVFRLPCSERELADRARAAMTSLGNQEPLLQGYYTRPKAVLWSEGMSRLEITGVFFPFTVEANVNVQASDYSIGAAMCHELSHMAGFMREDEANYLAYLACKNSADPMLDYSGTMLALAYCANALNRSAPDRYDLVRSAYSEGVRRDLIADANYWKQYDHQPASEFGEKMNDTYLKANAQSEGTRSYGAMVDLLLAEYRRSGQ